MSKRSVPILTQNFNSPDCCCHCSINDGFVSINSTSALIFMYGFPISASSATNIFTWFKKVDLAVLLFMVTVYTVWDTGVWFDTCNLVPKFLDSQNDPGCLSALELHQTLLVYDRVHWIYLTIIKAVMTIIDFWRWDQRLLMPSRLNLFGHPSNVNDLDGTFTYNNINSKTVDTFAVQNASSALYMIKKGL